MKNLITAYYVARHVLIKAGGLYTSVPLVIAMLLLCNPYAFTM